MSNYLSLTADVSLKASAEEGKRPTFEIDAYTGAPMNVGGYYTPVIVELTGITFSSKTIPILLDHDASKIIGQTSAIEIDESGVRLSGAITGDDEYSSRVITHAKNGFSWQASIGAEIIRQEFLKSGSKATVNGRSVSGPMLIARQSRLYETSFVALGADSKTSAKVAASKEKGNPMSDLDKWIKAKGFDPESLNDEQRSSLEASYNLEAKGPAVERDSRATTLDDVLSRRKAEDAREREITAIAESFTDRYPMLADDIHAIAREAVEVRSTPEQLRLQLYEVTTTVAPPRASGGHSSSGRPNAAVMEAAICQALKLEGTEKEYTEETLDAARRAYKDEIGLQEILFSAAEMHGHHFRSAKDTTALLEAASGKNGSIRAQGWSTFSLPGILSNVMNKMLVRYFNAVDNSWRGIAKIGRVPDFKTITKYSLVGDDILERLPPNGEIKHGTLGEVAYSNKADTYAKMLAISREDIINDDLGAFSEVAAKLARGSAKAMNRVIWGTFLDNSTFFSSQNNNALTGGESALDATGSALADAEEAFAGLTDPDGEPLGSMPQVLLVPTSLRNVAWRLMNSDLTVGGSNNVADGNPFRGRYKVVVSPYLSASTLTGNSSTAWYLLADPNDIPAIEVVFLNGRETPIVQQSDTEFNTLGVQWRVFHDFGATLQEPRAGIRSAGA